MTHSERAYELFKQGYNCSQAVLAAFCDVTGMDEKTALILSSSFGAGMGKLREVCGACSGMFMVAGLLYGYDSATDKEEKIAHYERIQYLANEFKAKYETIICRDLLKNIKTNTTPVPEDRTDEYYKVRPCVRLVEEAAKILDKYIDEHPYKK